MKNTATALTLSIATSVALYAAPNVPTTGDILRQVEQPKLPESPKALPSVKTGESKAPISAKDDVTTFIKTFTFSGNSVFTSEELLVLLKPYKEKELGLNGLKEIASIITRYYRDHGYFVARAYIPAQSLENGVVKIAVIEGAYGAFNIKNSSLVDSKEVQNFMDQLTQGDVVSTMSLERQMLLINDLSGAAVTNAEVYPGKEVGTSDFGVSIGALPKYTGYATVDNYGNRYTGESRLNIGGYINSLTGIGDTLSITGLISNTADLKNIYFGYDRPLGYGGLRGGVSFSLTDYTLEKIGNYEAYGNTNNAHGYISYPIIKTRAHTQTIEASFDHKNMNDSSGLQGLAEESKKSLNSLTLTGTNLSNISLFNLPGRLYASLGATMGNLNLKNDVARTNDAAGLNAEGNYIKANFSISHNQYLTEKTTLQTILKTQKSFGKNLDSAEDISVGGSNGVRAYEDSELSGDQGYALSIDLAYNLPRIQQITHNASIFLDNARVWKNDTTFNTEENIRTINAVGIGYGLNYLGFHLKATYAHGFGTESTPITESEFSTSKNKFLIQGIVWF